MTLLTVRFLQSLKRQAEVLNQLRDSVTAAAAEGEGEGGPEEVPAAAPPAPTAPPAQPPAPDADYSDEFDTDAGACRVLTRLRVRRA